MNLNLFVTFYVASVASTLTTMSLMYGWAVLRDRKRNREYNAQGANFEDFIARLRAREAAAEASTSEGPEAA